jgi:uncharacterized protein (TIGR02453 family)
MAAARFPHLAWKQTPAPGFYLHLEPSQSFLGMGLWHPDPETRGRVRNAIVTGPALWKKVTRAKRFTNVCKLGGDSAKRMPPGFAVDHPLADDLRRKDFICWTEFTEEQVGGADFLDRVSRACESAGPFMELLTRALELPWLPEERGGARGVLSIESLTF